MNDDTDLLLGIDNPGWPAFPMSDGRVLQLPLGLVCVRLTLSVEEGAVRKAGGDLIPGTWDEDRVVCKINVTDQLGEVVAATSQVSANAFLALARFPAWGGASLRPVLQCVQCLDDSREYIPTVGSTPEGVAQPFSYFAHYLSALIDICAWRVLRFDHLVVRVHPTRSGGVGGTPTPAVLGTAPWFGAALLWPGTFPCLKREPPRPLFEPTGRRDEPQAGVSITSPI